MKNQPSSPWGSGFAGVWKSHKISMCGKTESIKIDKNQLDPSFVNKTL